MTVLLAVSEANQTLQDPDKVKKINEILEEARAMVKKSVSCYFWQINFTCNRSLTRLESIIL